MATIDLNLVRAFVAVHATGSFSAAAERLGVPRSTVSRAVAALEASLGVRLFHRTTRSVSPSTAGDALFDRVAPPLLALEGSLGDLPERESVPSGLLRVTTTADLGAALLAAACARFTERYPQTRVEAHLGAQLVDLVRDGFDLALRVLVTPPRDSSLVARKVGVIDLQLHASPAYLARRGTPREMGDLAAHDWVGYRGQDRLVLSGPAGEAVIEREARIAADDMSFLRAALRAGAGIGPVPLFLAEADVVSGALVPVLPEWVSHTGTVYLVQPGRKHVPRKVTAFGEVLVEVLRGSPLVGRGGVSRA